MAVRLSPYSGSGKTWSQKRRRVMNYLKMISLAAIAAVAITALIAGNASATTLEIGGVVQSGAVMIQAESTAPTVIADTGGFAFNTCSKSSFSGTTSVFSGAKVTGSLSELSFTTCTKSPVNVDNKGGLYIEWESGTTSGTVFAENTQWTIPMSSGFTLTCSTGSGTTLGTLDGVKSTSEHATLTVNAILNCGFLLPSATWKGTYKVSSPTGLGVVS
jgi:hypothetical protein